MKLSYIDVSSGVELDQIDFSGDHTTYTTGVAKDQVDRMVFHYGKKAAIAILRSWSNGYVSFSEVR